MNKPPLLPKASLPTVFSPQGDRPRCACSSFLDLTTILCHFTPKDKKYASDKYKDIYTELSIAKAKADCDISRLKEQLKAATEALGEKSPDSATVSGYGVSLGHALWAIAGGLLGVWS